MACQPLRGARVSRVHRGARQEQLAALAAGGDAIATGRDYSSGMLAATMATTRKPTKTTTKPSGRPSTRRKPIAAAPPKTFAEVGREAAREAQRKVLLEAWEAHAWNMTATAEALSMGDGTAVIRALKALAPEEYEAAKKDGRISPANRRES